MIRKLHHNVYRCRDSAATRRFYEDFLGLPLAGAMELAESKTGRSIRALHTFFALDDGSYLAFFEVPEMPFPFKEQHDFDLHIALEVGDDDLEAMLAKGRASDMEVRGPIDHGFLRSIYFRDPSGYVIELTAKTPEHDSVLDPATSGARAVLDRWQASKAPSDAAIT